MSTYSLEVFMCRVVCWEGADEGVKMWQGVGVTMWQGVSGGSQCFTTQLVRVGGLGVYYVRVQK